MKIVGCDLHAKQQSIAMVDTETGEITDAKLHQWSCIAVTGLLNRLLASPNGESSNKSS
jgi:hypothetical protein